MISKELLSEVLKLKGISEIRISDNHIIFRYVDITHDRTFQINIYELAHKCKEWAYALDEWALSSGVDIFGRYFCTDNGPLKTFIASTEPEAIFQACQYILDNKEN